MTVSDEFQPPWFDSDVYNLCRKKERLHKDWKGSDNDTDKYMKFSLARREYRNLVDQKMNANFEDSDNRNLINKKFWSYVKSKSNSHRIPEAVNYGDRIRSDPLGQCELFNDFFKDQFSESSNYSIDIDFSHDHLFAIEFDINDIENLLRNLDPNKAQGPDKINGKVLKKCSNSLAVPLSLLFHMSYTTGQIPALWKVANVVPIHKKGSKIDVSNYRPISLTSLIMKVYERIIRKELLRRCEYLIDSRQHGFMESKSCCTQLVSFCDSLALSLNDRVRADIIYFDFQKAFDSVNHDIILNKLKHQYNIDGSLLRFFVSYLSDRHQ
ncbi:MAG: reverse transcriptase family protein, partial [Cytophagales bacterium]|nr:reverse transcriptase family protein [Cytophagales bacterium]